MITIKRKNKKSTLEEINELIISNMNVVDQCISHFSRVFFWVKDEDLLEDIKSEGYLWLVKSAHKWEPKRGIPFCKYAFFIISKKMISAYRFLTGGTDSPKRRKHKVFNVSTDKEMFWGSIVDEKTKDLFKEVDDKDEVAFFLEDLTEKQRKVMELCIMQGWSFTALTKDFKLSLTGVTYHRNQAFKKMREKEERRKI